MDQEEAQRLLEDKIRVTPQQVTFAKGYIVNHFQPETVKVIQDFLKSMEAADLDKLIIHLSVDTGENIRTAAQTISWILAGTEAIWGLISAGLLIPGSTEVRPPFNLTVSCTTKVQGSGHTGSLCLDHLSLPVPTQIRLPPSVSRGKRQTLSDPDLFLHALDIPGIHKEIEESLREAVRCFRHELFLACLAMLGRASEGAWIELGLKLCAVTPPTAHINIEKIKKILESPNKGIAIKIQETAQLYNHSDIFGDLYNASGVKREALNNSMVWVDVVRESRNSVHYRAESSMPNTYEKIAALLIGAVRHFRLLYKIINAAK
jgi:hypothetical protein